LLYDDPLAGFFKSLQRVPGFDVRLCCPARHPFTDLAAVRPSSITTSA
jgi:hypothetical protein